MRGTTNTRGRRQAQRWLLLNGRGLPPLDQQAFDLLTRRLDSRNRSRLVLAALLIASWTVLGVIAYQQFQDLMADETVHWSAMVGWLLLAASVTMAAGFQAEALVRALQDRRLAAGLTSRVSRSSAVTLSAIAGRRVLVAAALLATACAVTVVIAWTSAPGWPAVTVTACLAIGLAASAAGVVWALRRPTVAYDALTLTLDERLRRTDLVIGAQTLSFVLIMTNVAGPNLNTTGAIHGVWEIVFFLVLAVQILLTTGADWPGQARTPQAPAPSQTPATTPGGYPPPGGTA